MSFKVKQTVPTRTLYPTLGIEVGSGYSPIEVKYTALGINFGGRAVGQEAEVVFEVEVEGGLSTSLISRLIEVPSLDGDEILAHAEATLKTELGGE